MTAAEHLRQDIEFERRSLHGLVLEWELARELLRDAHGKDLRRPLFRLSDMEHQWGLWCGRKREITLSRRLVFHYSWYAVREVLLHEMAHQLAFEALGGLDEKPHGPVFLEACRLLRANPSASGNFEPLAPQPRRSPDPLHPRDRMLLRARKLLALAGSGNRHEAEAAMEKAQQLMKKYNLELIASHPERFFESGFLGEPALRHPVERNQLANLLQDFYFVSAVWVPVYVVPRGRMGRALEASGTPENLRMAEHVFDFVNRYIEEQWAEYQRVHGNGRGRKSEFASGVIEGFRWRLEKGSERRKSSGPGKGRALLRTTDPLLKKYVSDRYPFIRTSGRKILLRDEQARWHGLEKGRGLVIHRPLESDQSQGSGGLLPDR